MQRTSTKRLEKKQATRTVSSRGLFDFMFYIYFSKLGVVNTSRFRGFYMLWNEWFGWILEVGRA
jgi:hypothetical protein